MAKTKTIVALALASAAVYGGVRWRSAEPADKGQRVVDRIWIDHTPTSETDKVNIFLALTEEVAGDELGVFQSASMWTGQHELFKYKPRKAQLVVTYPQTGETETLTLTAKHCSDQRDMDFCLEVSGASRGVHKYYSRKGWEIEGAHTPAELEQRAQQLALTK